MTKGSEFTRALHWRLAREGNAERAKAQQAYMKSAMPYAGLTAPMVK